MVEVVGECEFPNTWRPITQKKSITWSLLSIVYNFPYIKEENTFWCVCVSGGGGFPMISSKEVPYCIMRELTNTQGMVSWDQAETRQLYVKNALIWIPLLKKCLNFYELTFLCWNFKFQMTWLHCFTSPKWSSEAKSYHTYYQTGSTECYSISLLCTPVIIKWKQPAWSISPPQHLSRQNI